MIVQGVKFVNAPSNYLIPVVHRITSYINNLHPKTYATLYTIIEKIIDRVIPLWNMTLTPLKSPEAMTVRVPYSECVYDPDPEMASFSEGPQPRLGETKNEYWDRREKWEEDTRRVVKPEPKPFTPPPALHPSQTVDLRRDYGSGGIQVIVKLANIHLTPEKPEYEGGTWHVEGQLVCLRLPMHRCCDHKYLLSERTYLRLCHILLRY
jgi:hypothetical protein